MTLPTCDWRSAVIICSSRTTAHVGCDTRLSKPLFLIRIDSVMQEEQKRNTESMISTYKRNQSAFAESVLTREGPVRHAKKRL